MRYLFCLALGLLLACRPPSAERELGPEPALGSTPSAMASSPSPTSEEEPRIVVRVGGQMRRFTRAELLRHSELRRLTFEDRSAYEGQTLTFSVVPLASLFEGLTPAEDETMHYDTLDGFSSSIEPSRLLNTDPEGAIAYLAIEPADDPWPAFHHGEYGAGPFYVVWKNPELSSIGREEWPFKLKGFKALPSIEKRYPSVSPAKDAPDEVQTGYRSFIKNCFPCHTMNGEGSANFGPDLNQPHNPTEYFAPGFLRKLIRDPQSLRTWPRSKMTGFSEHEISDSELDALLAYLAHMSR